MCKATSYRGCLFVKQIFDVIGYTYVFSLYITNINDIIMKEEETNLVAFWRNNAHYHHHRTRRKWKERKTI